MLQNNSPWLRQLPERTRIRLTSDIATDVAIIGGGIAGVSTAFQILQGTTKRVVLLERYRLAHGATGHNAGQVVAQFERGLVNLAEKFGPALTIAGQQAIESAWETLDAMYVDAHLDIPYYKCEGFSGFTSEAQTLMRLEQNRLRAEGGLAPENIYIDEDAPFIQRIPRHYTGLYTRVSSAKIRAMLETERRDFVAVHAYPKGVINSALLCERLVTFLLERYPDRFTLYEHAHVRKILLNHEGATLDVETHTVEAEHVVLCTNGFEDMHIIDKNGLAIDARYHYLVSGVTGYMSGYLEESRKNPVAISYHTDPGIDPKNAYYYLTRRPYEYESGAHRNLISIGGPEFFLEDTSVYDHEAHYPEEHMHDIDAFVKSTYETDPGKAIKYTFTWHGLMGYTRNGVRLVGPEPENPVLLYNLGCNGIGILPSIYGATKITRHIRGEAVEASLFDVPTKLPRATGILPALQRLFKL